MYQNVPAEDNLLPKGLVSSLKTVKMGAKRSWADWWHFSVRKYLARVSKPSQIFYFNRANFSVLKRMLYVCKSYFEKIPKKCAYYVQKWKKKKKNQFFLVYKTKILILIFFLKMKLYGHSEMSRKNCIQIYVRLPLKIKFPNFSTAPAPSVPWESEVLLCHTTCYHVTPFTWPQKLSFLLATKYFSVSEFFLHRQVIQILFLKI